MWATIYAIVQRNPGKTQALTGFEPVPLSTS